jgi:thioester reductase-like protein
MSESDENQAPEAIAILGMAGRFPRARDLDQLWRNLREGVDGVRDLTDEELLASGIPPEVFRRPDYVRAAAPIDGADRFDASFFNVSPREAEILDPQQRVFLEVAWEALESAGYVSESYPGWIGVFAGISMSTYMLHNLFPNEALMQSVGGFPILLSNDRDYFATRVSYKLNLRGMSVNVQTACSTSLVAVHMACQALLDYQCTLALAGGVRVFSPQITGYPYVEGGIYSPDGRCRAFDAEGKGALFSEGAGVVVLKRLSEALADGDPIRAVILGSASNNDGSYKVGYTAPSVEGQAEVIAMAQAAAGVDPESIGYVETHGSGTPLGDPIEVAALTKAFRAATDRQGFCAVGSLKASVGHMEAAAGIGGLIKTVLALENAQIPPSLHFKTPNPRIDFASSPFYVSTRLADWPRNGAPRRAGVSSFGMGGTNAHAILEEAPEREPSGPSRPWQLLVLSAKTPTALEAATDRLADWLEAHPEETFADVAWTLQVGRRTFPHRRALVCRDREDALAALRSRDPRRLLGSVQEPAERPITFLFSGLGDHYVDMGLGLYRDEPAFREAIDRCAEILRPYLEVDLRTLLWPELSPPGPMGSNVSIPRQAPPNVETSRGASPGRQRGSAGQEQRSGARQWGDRAPADEAWSSVAASETPHGASLHWGESAGRGRTSIDLKAMLGRGAPPQEDEASRRLNQTRNTQPALFAVEYALAQTLLDLGFRPEALVGYSLGEYVAACVAGVLPLEDILPLVARRARWIDELEAGAMLAVPLPEAEAAQAIKDRVEGRGLSLAALNGPSLSVIAGPLPAVDDLERELTGRGVAVRRLPTTHAFHSTMMEPLRERLVEEVRKLRPRAPEIPYLSNVTGTWITAEEATDPGYWGRHLCQPVRFGRSLEELRRDPSRILLELGPGLSLTTLALQGDAGTLALQTMRAAYDRQDDQAFLLGTVARLWLAGLPVDWEAFSHREKRHRLRLPTYPFERQRYWIDPPRHLPPSGVTRQEMKEAAPEPAGPPAEALPRHARPAHLRNPYVEPGTGLELRLAAIWQDLLGMEKVGIHDGFFELGGHSLLAPQLVLRMKEAFGVEFPLAHLFETPTVAEMAQAVATLQQEGTLAAGPEIDLAAEVALDPAIRAEGEPVADLAHPRDVVLTGATGFLGAFLLRELLRQTGARVRCVVRARDAADGLARIRRRLEAAGIRDEGWEGRILAIPGDLEKPLWGLSEEAFDDLADHMDAVYHCGAWVNFTYPYKALKAANVTATEDAIRLAGRKRTKPLHFISSIAAVSPAGMEGDGLVYEDRAYPVTEGLFGGYGQTKWVGEGLVRLGRERGIPGNIYRPGVVSGDSENGAGNTSDLVWNIIRGSIQLGAAPEHPFHMDVAPVDYIAAAVVHLSLQPDLLDRTFHFPNPAPLPWRRVFDFAESYGYPLRRLPLLDWQREVVAVAERDPGHALAPFASLFAVGEETAAAGEQPELRFDGTNTARGLEGSGIVCPPVDERLLRTYFDAFVRSGFLEPVGAEVG